MAWSVREAADALGVSPQRVRELLAAGRLAGHKVGGRWLVEPQTQPRHPLRGRPLSAQVAWAALAMLAGHEPSWIAAEQRSRLRRQRRLGGLVEQVSSASPRATIHRLRVLPRDRDALATRGDLSVTGRSAGLATIDLPASATVLDAYASSETLDEVRGKLHAIELPTTPNLILRVPSHPWILTFSTAPVSVVAADLLDDEDPRVARAARAILREIAA